MESVNHYKHADPGKIDRIANDLLRTVRLNKSFLIWMAVLFGVLAVCLYGYTIQLREGLGVTGLRDITSWGMYIANLVFFVAFVRCEQDPAIISEGHLLTHQGHLEGSHMGAHQSRTKTQVHVDVSAAKHWHRAVFGLNHSSKTQAAGTKL